MSAISGSVVQNQESLLDPSKKRKSPDSPETTPKQKAALSTSGSSFETASSELISHLEATGSLEKPTWKYEYTQNDFSYLMERTGFLQKINTHGDVLPEQVLVGVIEIRRDTLQEISLECCPQYSAELFSKLATCTQLKVLLAPRNNQLNSAMVASIASIRTLQKLDLESCTQLRDDDLKLIAEGNSQLQELKLRDCRNLTDQGIEFLAKGPKSLTVLDISWCPLITDRALEALAENAKTITSLNLSSCRELTDNGVQRLIPELKLQFLVLRGCVKLTDGTLFEIADSGRWTIQSLDLSYCEKITDTGIKAIAEYCQELKKLKITSCQFLSGLSVMYLAKLLPTLEVLILDKIFLDDLASLSKKFPNLRELGIGGIDVMWSEFALAKTCQAIRALCATTTSLKELHLGGGLLFYEALGQEFYKSIRERNINII
jgi:hypothetical protein